MHVRSSIKSRMKSCLAAATLTTMSLTSMSAEVPSAPAAVQKARHDHYHDLGEANKVVRDQVRGGNPDYAALEKAADHIQKASIDQGKWFPKGSGPEAGKTRALPEIWAKPADFDAAQKMFSERAPKLLAAVKAKDVDAIRTTYRELGASCKNCHDQFRSPEDH